MSHVMAARPASGGTFSIYVGVWLCLALVSMGYIAIAIVRPDVLSDRGIPGMTAAANRASDPAAVQSGLVERGITEVRNQLTDIQLKIMRGELREQELAQRIASIEARLEELSTPAVAVTPAPAPAPQAVSAPTPPPAVRLPGTTVTQAEKPLDRRATAHIARQQAAARPQPEPATAAPRAADDTAEADAAKAAQKPRGASPIETSSVRRDIPPFGAPEVRSGEKTDKAADDGPVGLQLGGAPSLDSLRLNWSILSDRHGDALANLQPRYVTSDALGTTSFNLVAGPVASRTEAIRLCAKLRTQGVTCRLTSFTGSSL